MIRQRLPKILQNQKLSQNKWIKLKKLILPEYLYLTDINFAIFFCLDTYAFYILF